MSTEESTFKSVCPKCGKPNDEGNAFCSYCGKNLAIKKISFPKKEMVMKIATFAVALFFLIMAFLPIHSTTFQHEKSEFSLDLSPIDSIVLFFDSTAELDDEDIIDSKLYEQLEEMDEEMEDVSDALEDGDRLSSEEVSILSDYLKTYIRLTYQSEYVETTPQIITTAVISVFYLFFAIAFAFYAGRDLLLSVRGAESSGKKTSALLCTAPGAILLMCFMYEIIYGSSLVTSVQTSDITVTSSITASAVISMIFVLLLIVVRAFLYLKVKENRLHVEWIRRLLSVACIVLLFIASLLPVISINFTVKDEDEKKISVTDKLGAYIFTSLHLTEDVRDTIDEIDDLDEWRESNAKYAFSSFEGESRKELKKIDEADGTSKIVAYAIWYADPDKANAYSLVNVIMLIALAGAMLALSSTLLDLIGDENKSSRYWFGSIVSLLMSGMALVLVFMTIETMNRWQDLIEESIEKVSVTIGICPFLMIVASIALLIIGHNHRMVWHPAAESEQTTETLNNGGESFVPSHDVQPQNLNQSDDRHEIPQSQNEENN